MRLGHYFFFLSFCRWSYLPERGLGDGRKAEGQQEERAELGWGVWEKPMNTSKTG